MGEPLCDTGRSQSPIDLPYLSDALERQQALNDSMDYNKVKFAMTDVGNYLKGTVTKFF